MPSITPTPPDRGNGQGQRPQGPSITPARNSGRAPWIWGGLAVLFGGAALLNAFDDAPKRPPVPATTPQPPAPEPVSDRFVIARTDAEIYVVVPTNPAAINASTQGQPIAKVESGSCMQRFTPYGGMNQSPRDFVHLSATSKTGYSRSGEVELKRIKPAPASMTEVDCHATFTPPM